MHIGGCQDKDSFLVFAGPTTPVLGIFSHEMTERQEKIGPSLQANFMTPGNLVTGHRSNSGSL